MKIRVDFFKESGKWYEGGEVEIGEARLWNDLLPQAIVCNQNILIDGWQDRENFTVVTSDLPEEWAKKEYKEFFHHIFKPLQFRGLRRQ